MNTQLQSGEANVVPDGHLQTPATSARPARVAPTFGGIPAELQPMHRTAVEMTTTLCVCVVLVVAIVVVAKAIGGIPG